MADLRGWSPFTALQIEYSLLQRTVESDLLPMARAFDLAVTPWSPLAGGLLYLPVSTPREEGQEMRYAEGDKSPYLNEKNLGIAQVVVDIAAELGVSAAQVALAWLLEKARHHNGVMIPIIASRKASQLVDNIGALDVRLSDEQITRLSDISAYPMPFPQSFVETSSVDDFVYGGTRNSMDTHRPRVSL